MIVIIAGNYCHQTVKYGSNATIFSFCEFIYLFEVLRCFQHCTGHIMTGGWKGRGNQYIQFVRVLYCKLPINGKQIPVFPLEAVLGTEPRPQRWEARVLSLCHCGPYFLCLVLCWFSLNKDPHPTFTVPCK